MNQIIDGYLALLPGPDAKNRFLLTGEYHDGPNCLLGTRAISFGLADPTQISEFAELITKTERADTEWDPRSLIGLIDLIPRPSIDIKKGQCNHQDDYAVRTYKIALISWESGAQAEDRNTLRPLKTDSASSVCRELSQGAKSQCIDWGIF